MRIWRDIISRQAWLKIVERFNAGYVEDVPNSWTTAKDGPVNKMGKLRSAFDGTLSSPTAFISQKLTPKIESYHGIQKSEYRNIDRRISALKDISSCAADFLKTFGVDMDFAATRHGASADRDADRNAYTSSNPRDVSMDRHILTLVRRSLRKASYLKMLKRYYSFCGAEFSYRSPTALLSLIQTPKGINQRTGWPRTDAAT